MGLSRSCALGIAAGLERCGAVDGNLVMVDKYDFEFAPGMTNPYIPVELFEQDLFNHNDENTGGMSVDELNKLVSTNDKEETSKNNGGGMKLVVLVVLVMLLMVNIDGGGDAEESLV